MLRKPFIVGAACLLSLLTGLLAAFPGWLESPTGRCNPHDPRNPNHPSPPRPAFSATISPTFTSSPTFSASPTASPSATISPTYTVSPTPSPSASATPTPICNTIRTAMGDGSIQVDQSNTVANGSASTPYALAMGPNGELYVDELAYGIIRRVDRDGSLHVVVGFGTGALGDNGPAINANLDDPAGICVDTIGQLYIADTNHARIRKVDVHGVISTVAGTGVPGFSGDNGPATAAKISAPAAVCADELGNLYFSENTSNRVRKISPSGTITTVAGTGVQGFNGDGLPGTLTQLHNPYGLALGADGVLYIADVCNYRIRALGLDGNITTFAGTGSIGTAVEGAAATASPLQPIGLCRDASYLYFGDASHNMVGRIDGAGNVHWVAGSVAHGNTYYGDGGPAIAAGLSYPVGLALDPGAGLYIADVYNNRVRLVPCP